MIIVLFGQSGAGKTFIGDIFAKESHYYFWDADQGLPPIMRETLQNKQLFTQAMRDQFTQVIIEKITELHQQYPNLVIAQALYKEKNREQIRKVFPEAKFIYVKSQEEIINARLQNRNNQIDVNYAEKIRINFEAPNLQHDVLINNSDATDIIKQLKMLLPII